MSVTHLGYDENTEYGRKLSRFISLLQEALNSGNSILGIMNRMKDGDGSQAVHFDYLVSRFGFEGVDTAAKQTVAKATFDELNSLMFKLNTDSSVSDVNAAIKQIGEKLG